MNGINAEGQSGIRGAEVFLAAVRVLESFIGVGTIHTE